MVVVSSKPQNPPPETVQKCTVVGLSVGSIIAERYRIEAIIGEGGMGTVYAAEHLALRKRVAVKVLHLDLLRLPNIVARFEREARATARIEHPNVASAIDFGRLPSGALYLVLEFVDGRRLREQIARGPLELARALNIARQIASVLVAAQALGIVHRDLKPENVILVHRDDEPDFVKVLDFGIARMASAENDGTSQPPLTKLGAVFGTPEYMAPEQALGQRVDARADLYSLGVMLFEMITGTRPYLQTGQSGILSQQMTSPRPTFAERAPDIQVPKEVERLVYRLLAKGAKERYQNAADVVAGLEGLLAVRAAERGLSSIPSEKCSDPLPSFDLNTQFPGLQSEPVKPWTKFFALARGKLKLKGIQTERWCRTIGLELLKLIDRCTEKVLRHVPVAANRKFRDVPRSVSRTLVALGALSLLALAGLLFSSLVQITGRQGEAKIASSAPTVTSASAIALAKPHASVVLTPLDENSKDPDVVLALSVARLYADNEVAALSLVVRALSRQPERRNDERVATVLYRTAKSGQKEVADKSLALLQGIMAAKGAEIQYQLWLDRSVRETVRKRIERWLRSEVFERTASGAIHIAVKLRMAESCEKKLKLLPTAAKIGGLAAIGYLEELQSTTGCGIDGKSDCYPCLRAEPSLKDTAAQIRLRLDEKD